MEEIPLYLKYLPIFFFSLILLLFFIAKGIYWDASSQNENAEQGDAEKGQNSRPNGCCGKHEVCLRQSLLAANVRSVADYFEDEELDAFQGRDAFEYSPEEIEQFEEVLTTLRPEEVADWLAALERRSIELPIALRDEAVMLVEEANPQ